MDNIEFWIYIIFAVVYFLSRALRKKSQKKQPTKAQSPLETDEQQDTHEQPVSFEELLEEITGRRSKRQEPEEEQPWGEQEVQEAEPKVPQNPEPPKEQFEEGKTRRFADDESKRIYEESIKRAEGADLAYEPDEHFASKKLFKGAEDEEETNEFAQELRDTLQDPEGVRKAIVLSEILNRRY